ncbi:acyl carrier protein [Eggerthia catenaformis]|uniref:acyl carrier protein n=1 Tax=Eggerthia catenaformis TaxID=31973 RepID=UPI00248DE930|nr:acyl carrier protein [Eggerthia catenaformis]
MEYFDRIKEVLNDKLHGKELTLDSSFRDLGIDSLDLVDLVFELEEEIGIEFEDEELISITTVKDLLTLIDKKTA